jgi:hypothetical protein
LSFILLISWRLPSHQAIMATHLLIKCEECGHRWQAIEYGYLFGGFSGRLPDDFQWQSCPNCLVGVTLPLCTDYASWRRWRETTAAVDCGFTPFANSVCGQIEVQIPPDGARVELTIADIPCPGCGRPLERGSGNYDERHVQCPECGRLTGRVVQLDDESSTGHTAHPF